MLRLIKSLCFIACLSPAAALSERHVASEMPTAMTQVNLCYLNEGKTMEDVDTFNKTFFDWTRAEGIQHYPGIYRDVTWGIRERGIWKVQAGWDNDVLVVASKTRGINVLERYQLQGRSRLLVSLDIEADGNVRSISRSFQRRR